jgi:hypothetical protein
VSSCAVECCHREVRTNSTNASIGHIYARTERSIAAVEAASVVATSILTCELEGAEAAAVAAAAAATARADEVKEKAGIQIQVHIAPKKLLALTKRSGSEQGSSSFTFRITQLAIHII